MRRLVSTLAFVAVTSAAMGCMHQGAGNQGTQPQQASTLQVVNQGFLDMDVFVLAPTSARIRLGTATGNSTTQLRIPGNLIFGPTPLRFVADPIGGTRAEVTQSITVIPGDTVVLTIPPGP